MTGSNSWLFSLLINMSSLCPKMPITFFVNPSGHLHVACIVQNPKLLYACFQSWNYFLKIISCSTSCNRYIWFYFIMKTRLGPLVPVPCLGHINTHHIKLHPKVCKSESGCYDMYKMWTLAMENIPKPWLLGTICFLFAEREQSISTTFLILNHNLLDVCFTPVWPLCVPSFQQSPMSSLLLSVFSLCLSYVEVFKVQTTKAGCLNPKAVIDRLTKNRDRDWDRERRERESQCRQRRSLKSLSEPEGLFLSVSMRHYWTEDAPDTRDEMTNGERRMGVGGRAKGEV